MHENKVCKDEIRKIIKSGFEYKSLFYAPYDFTVFSISQNHGWNYLKFNQILNKKERYSKGIGEKEFISLLKNNKIDLVNDFNFTDLYNDQTTVWLLIHYSIQSDNYEFVNLLLKKSVINLCDFYNVRELYFEVTILLRK